MKADALTFPVPKADILHPDPIAQKLMDLAFMGENGRVNLLPARLWSQAPPDQLRLWCASHARYGIPTVELIAWLKDRIGNRTALEIGAGCGDLGFHLGIKMTDSYQQVTDPATLAYMTLLNQKPTTPSPDVIKEDAEQAVRHFKPQVVIGSWITEKFILGQSFQGNMYGPREEYILDRCETYIVIGNENTHGSKRIRAKRHETHRFPWLISRAKDPAKNVIYVWENGRRSP